MLCIHVEYINYIFLSCEFAKCEKLLLLDPNSSSDSFINYRFFNVDESFGSGKGLKVWRILWFVVG
ncbi:hypothetical protein Lalb_Chr02g0150451 [Lupinus albus]|uniref:Uncharacterized protein n=1 Tax=Lupinus albus TaxID=3870 RepID=A0A6A4R0D0_LUPAL|nr:hypothetical protein Lalb_Chr02g0150451 [Lupinus albus]